MALLTVQNETSRVLNRPEVGGSGVSPDAVGGNVLDPLPFPFNANGTLAANGDPGDSKQLGIHARDLSVRTQAQQPMIPADEWAALVQAGVVSLTFAADAQSLDAEDALGAAL